MIKKIFTDMNNLLVNLFYYIEFFVAGKRQSKRHKGT